MKRVTLLAMVFTASMFAGSLSFESGMIKAHTEVFGDSTIDPVFKKAQSRLSMEESAESLRGAIEVSIGDLISDNKKRDDHMYEALESSSFPKAIFEIKEMVARGGDKYALKGSLSLHGVTKPFSFEGSVSESNSKVRIKATSALKMSDFGIKPIKMMFLTVRDQVDVSVDVSLKR